MWDLLLNIGVTVAMLIMLAGAALSYFLLKNIIGAEVSIIIGMLLAAYPGYLAYKKIEM